ncbi:MAG: DMT family transporter [Anaerolineales bacterium]|jgi:drug/metabolite transporter (DMT)-like permease
MPTLAIVLLFLSASLHTLWNLLLKGTRHKFIASWWIVTIGAVMYLPGLFLIGLPPREIWHIAFISAGLEAAYMYTLSLAYKNGDFSLVYPMARGSAPAFLLLWSLLLLNEGITGWGLIGLMLIISGLILSGASSLIQNRKNIPNSKGIAAALGTAFFISTYTFVDGSAVKRGPALTYGILMFTLIPVWLTPIVLRKYGWSQVVGEWKKQPVRLLIIGFLSVASYLIALYAYSFAPISYSGAIREVSVVLGALAGWYFLGEKMGPVRVIGALVIFSGILVIALMG